MPALDEADDAALGDMEEDPATEEEEEEEPEEEDDDPDFAPTAEDMSCDGNDVGNASEDEDLRMDSDAVLPVSAAVTTRSGRATRLSTRAMESKGQSPAPVMTTRARASSQVPTDMETDHEATEDEEQDMEDETDADRRLLKPAKQSLFLRPKPVPSAVPVQEGSASASANALVDYDMRYNHTAKGVPGLEQLLLVLNRNELAAVVQVQCDSVPGLYD